MLLILIIFIDGYQLIIRMVYVHNVINININFVMSVNVINYFYNLNVIVLHIVNGTIIHVINYNVQRLHHNNNVQ